MKNSLFPFVLLISACGLSPKTSNDDTADDTGSNITTGVTIADVQTGEVQSEEIVTLQGVIVTSPLNADANGFFVQSPGGGEWSGLYVYVQAGFDGLYMEVGDEVTVTGEVTEFYDWTELTVSGETAVEITGSGTVTIDTVDPSAVDNWEAWESCLITVGAAEVVDGLDSYGEVELHNGLVMDNLFFDFEAYEGSTFTNITGPLGWNFEEWKLFPRTEADLEGAVHPALEVVSVYDIQTGAASGTVYLEGVVATSGVSPDGKGLFVSDAAGGEYSGVYIYEGGGYDEEIFAGDILNITATVKEYTHGDSDEYSLTELTSTEIEVVGAGAVPAATVLASAPADWEPYEGVLVSITAVEVTGVEEEYNEYQTNWDIEIDDFLYEELSASVGQTYSVVTGILQEYWGYKLCPRDASDLSE